MSTLISALPKSDDEREEEYKGEELCCTECDKKGFFCDGIEKCDMCGEGTCYECDPEGKQIGDNWVCSSCQEESEEEEEEGEEE
jgi:RecJ-like exonuclease